MSPLIPRLLAILAHHGFQWTNGEAPVDLEIRRIRVGRGERSSGAWSWHFWSDSRPGEALDVGSQFPARELARLRPEQTGIATNAFGQTHIFPTPAVIRPNSTRP